MTGALLDTSIVIAFDPHGTMSLPDVAAVSVVTLGELRAGVIRAPAANVRAARQARLAAVRNTFVPLVVDEPIADHYGELLARARSSGRATKATDLLIVATAIATGRTLHTLDRKQGELARHAGAAVAVAS